MIAAAAAAASRRRRLLGDEGATVRHVGAAVKTDAEVAPSPTSRRGARAARAHDPLWS
jgi:hypothetical protein